MRARLTFLLALSIATASWRAHASPLNELVREAREHEAAHDDLVAIERYMQALSLDPMCADAYLGLGALRARDGDLREAERVFSVALAHVPTLHAALVARAETRWTMGRHEEAEADLEEYASRTHEDAPMRILARWYGDDGKIPAELATWRTLLARAHAKGDAALLHDARTMVRALQIVIALADPASHPPRDEGVRKVIADAAKRGD